MTIIVNYAEKVLNTKIGDEDLKLTILTINEVCNAKNSISEHKALEIIDNAHNCMLRRMDSVKKMMSLDEQKNTNVFFYTYI